MSGNTQREMLGSRLGFLLLSAGCAIGLGNVWRFPYITGAYGGAIFVGIYLLCLFAVVPTMIMEFAVGRAARRNMGLAFHILEPKGSKWHWGGKVALIGSYLLMMFYTTVTGWMLAYCWHSFSGNLSGLDTAGVASFFGSTLASPFEQVLGMTIVVGVGCLVCAMGVQKGVERVVKVIMVGLLAILVLLVSVFKLPALLGMGLTVVVSIVFAMVFQGVNFVELMNYAANGFTLSTGVDIVDPMLNRGGITSMTGLLITFMVASVMGGIITATGILDVLAKDVLLKFIKSRGVLVTVTLIYCYIVNFLTAGGQTVAIIVTEQTFEDAFDRMGIHRRVLSRTLEDAGTLSAPIVPWGVATLYVMEVLGCGTEYIPYCWFIFIVPIFSILCAFSGFGIWDKDGNKMWGRKKAAAK